MSLHSQLLRGVLALPLTLLLAVAAVIAPDATPASLPAADAAASHQPLVFKGPLPGACPHRIVRVQLAAR